MENGLGNSVLAGGLDEDEAEQQSNINISDVIEVIHDTDPAYREALQESRDSMYGVGAPAPPPEHVRPQPKMFVKIVEQPAPKALRFRYECEGRSAGSIPGARSTPENKTYPTIEVVGYKGRAVVVVSCVTKDEPHKPHPHNLVGKDGCKKGVCTLEINPETMSISFSNLGIQCVKKRDIEDALTQREELRVDPFRTGFAHKSQPSSIDLNAVRLCFQVFLEDQRSGSSRLRMGLPPVVSEIIFDKKAMSDLAICKLSHFSASVEGGQEVIMLCEKVAKEDITIRFFEEQEGKLLWEGQGDFQHTHVHKQVAIAFRTPAYKPGDTNRHVKAFIQLRRPSDGATSEPISFELKPIDAGRHSARRKHLDSSILDRILEEEALKSKAADNDRNNNEHSIFTDIAMPQSIIREIPVNESDDSTSVNVVSESSRSMSVNASDSVSNGNIGEDLRESVTTDPSSVDPDTVDISVSNNDKTLNELLDQVAELDEIYSDHQTRLETLAALSGENPMDIDELEDFEDTNTYTSLQLAFKNPVPFVQPESETFPYEDVLTATGPIIEFTTLKRDPEEEKLPPLPPKRIRKTASVEALRQTAAGVTTTVAVPKGSVENIIKPGRPLPLSCTPSSRQALTSSQSENPLPATPSKKRSFLSRLFHRKPKKDKSAMDTKADAKKGKPVGRSVSSVSGLRPPKYRQDVSQASLKGSTGNLSLGASLRYTDSITHISLHEDDSRFPSTASLKRPTSVAPLPPMDGDTILVAENVLAMDVNEFRRLQDNLDLTEAEHYALYMALAPRATASEFDETSCYYSPVEGGKIHDYKS